MEQVWYRVTIAKPDDMTRTVEELTREAHNVATAVQEHFGQPSLPVVFRDFMAADQPLPEYHWRHAEIAQQFKKGIEATGLYGAVELSVDVPDGGSLH